MYQPRLLSDLKEFILTRHVTLPPELRAARALSRALRQIQARWPDTRTTDGCDATPVFVFSAGWRSGSTLMQRLVMSSGEIAVWGEPLGDAAIVARLGHSLSAITGSWPPESFFDSGQQLEGLADEWIANLTPQIHYLRSAHAALLREWLGSSAQTAFGIARWGLKEVRLTIDHARYLKWLFPDSRFIFVYRNPFHAFRSWKGNRWHSTWPGYYHNSAIAYGRHWRLLMDGFLEGHADVDGILVRFEDLVSGAVDIDNIARHIQVNNLNPDVLDRKVGTPKGTAAHGKPEISWFDRAALKATCGSLLGKLGY